MSHNYVCLKDEVYDDPNSMFDLQLKYELSKYNPDDTVTLFYDPEFNCFIESEFGYVVYAIHQLVKPWQIMLFKNVMRDLYFPDVTNKFLVELIYPDAD